MPQPPNVVSSLKGRSFLAIRDLEAEEIRGLVDSAAYFKRLKEAGEPHRLLEGKNIVLIFEKTSTRTRASFEVAGSDLGLGVTYLDSRTSQMGDKESIADTARVLGGIYDAIEYRGFGQEIVEELAERSGVPVINGLTDEAHPTQTIADLLTIAEHAPGGIEGAKVAYFGDARNNVANSLLVGLVKLGVDVAFAAPEGLQPAPELLDWARAEAKNTGSTLTVTTDPAEAAAGATALYTDIWVSMGEPEELWAERIERLKPYQVTSELVGSAADGAIVLHCLPAFHNKDTTIGAAVAERFGLNELEITDEVFESAASKVFEQAANRMHTIKAIIAATLA
ncbi:ornithine carbamoyltransferase [Corynebacterium otitidis]|mgnify:CR=1 FL=1|uniref:Ornithine carbamoyltransferase n=1 Tax=Corynebacterium otitidis ATCC 51513 TaxID=883169 RepID=I7IWY0_9CORY|nr:ornithine carbamoyltransferase [Corynebacterium otitidis]EJZ82164.1 ornithine carbamoyltransferase [Corynebacterium otitidis ATCC 51513]KKO84383.1 ornithine carbamoyltransferase [Corynebacterium otitidis]CCI83338.1 ornithine carbamoyltransferase [Corynebacterium otitidis ATCC 51513]